MRKLKGLSLALLSALTISLMINSVQTLIIPPVKQGLTVTAEPDKLTVDSPLVEIVISTTGVRPTKWFIKDYGIELAEDAQPSGLIGKRTSLWDWIPGSAGEPQDWPGEISVGVTSEPEILEQNDTVAVVRFEYTCTGAPITDLIVEKILTFYVDKYYFDMKITLNNPTGSPISTASTWDATVGYCINIVDYEEPVSQLYQAYQDGLTPYLDLNLGWNRIPAANLTWVAVYNKETGAIVGIACPKNTTNTVWFEGGRGAWGSEARIEYNSLEIPAGSQVVYPIKVYGGPPDLPQLTEVGMGNLGAGIAFSVDMDDVDGRFVYSENDTCHYVINLTNGLTEPFTDVEVNVTLWTSNQFGHTLTKVRDVQKWPKFDIDPRSTESLVGSLTFDKKGIYCLNAEIYKEDALTSELVLLTPVLPELLPGQEPLTVCFVWNLDQPIVMDEKGDFRRNFVHDTVEEGTLYTEGTPYLLHAELLKKHTKINVTFNLQPSLLYQWNMTANSTWILYWWNAITGFAHWDPAPQSESEGAREALESYKELAARDQIELLASPFYSPLMPVLLAKNWTSDITDQLQMSKEYIQDLMEVNPTGLWIPEMAFNMSLVPIINNTGLEYIVLDHRMLENVTGLTHADYNAWYVKDPHTNKTVVAFFRARYTNVKFDDLCNRLVAGWNTAPRHSQAARELVTSLYYVFSYKKSEKKVITIAADEWVSTGGPAAHQTLDDFYSAIEQCSGWLKTATLKSASKHVSPTKTVTNLPEGSWTNPTSIDDWVGEFNSTDSRLNMTYWLWNTTETARNEVMEYAEALSAEERAADENLKLAMKYIYIAEASYWYKTAEDEFTQEQVERYTELAVKTLFPEFDVWKAYGVYIITGCFVAVVALVAVWAYRRQRIKPAP